jgi:hypothetical protein
VHGDFAAEVGEREGGLPVTAVHRAEQGEESLVLVDGEELAVAKGPALGGIVPGDNLYLTQKGFGHGSLLSVCAARSLSKGLLGQAAGVVAVAVDVS